MNEEIMNQFQDLLSRTERLCFPRFCSIKKKTEIISIKKEQIENQIKEKIKADNALLTKFNQKKEELWKKSEKESSDEFENIPSKLKINSFYFQELMHRYVENIYECLEREWGNDNMNKKE